jgi:hypothetical protein
LAGREAQGKENRANAVLKKQWKQKKIILKERENPIGDCREAA